MTVTDEENILEPLESVEESKKEENIEPEVTIPPVKYVRPPAFQRAGNFGKSNFQNNTSNNRQRPGRAA
jgi:hypothetical protein